jgi:hypothetical protein
MDKLELALRLIASCTLCEGRGYDYWSNGEDFDAEPCQCNIYDIILDDDGDVIYDNGLSTENDLAIFATMEAR